MCDGCNNQRGLISSRDYDFCEQCKQMLCPPCTLQWHRNHRLMKRVDRLRELDFVSQKLESAAKTLASVERIQEVSKKISLFLKVRAVFRRSVRLADATGTRSVLQDTRSERANESATNHRQSNALAQAAHSLNQKTMQCRQQLDFIRGRKNALARGWDETSQSLEAVFDRYAEEARGIRRHIERLRNAEVSLTLSSSSSDETTPSTASTSSNTATGTT